MASWPEIVTVKSENRHELILSGSAISERINESGIDKALFLCDGLNFLRISETSLDNVPPRISKLANLTSLVLHTNKLSELCPEIGQLSKLKLLDASNNDLKEMPPALNELEHLSSLKLSFNKISVIPSMVKNVWLSSVDLSCNVIEDISELCRKELIHLSELYLKGNKISSIPSSINELVALKVLDLSENEILLVPGEIGDISKLKDIKLDRNPLSDKRLGKLVSQCKSKQVLDYIREHCPRASAEGGGGKGGKKGKGKGRAKQNSEEPDVETTGPKRHKIQIAKASSVLIVRRTDFVSTVRPHIAACRVSQMSLTSDTLRSLIQLQTRLHETICEKRNLATLATHDLDKCGDTKFIYTALSPDALVLVPLNHGKKCTGRELFGQLKAEADSLRKEKKRSAYSGIHKYLHLLQDKPLFPCLLNAENTVISFPPLTNSDVTKLSVDTKSMLIEVTSSASQAVCKKILDALLKEMTQMGLCTLLDESGVNVLHVEQVKVEEVDGALHLVYPSRSDLPFDDVIIMRE